MRSPLVIAAVAVLLIAGVAVFLLRNGAEEPVPTPATPASDDGPREDIRRLSAELERLSAEVRRLDRQGGEPRPSAPRPISAVESETPRNARDVKPMPARWYLDQYVLSFEGGGSGSEYFRLAVDAYARELVEPIVEIVIDAGRQPPLRTNLVAILGTPRFSGNGFVIDALVSVIQAGDPRPLAVVALKALPVVGGPGTVAALERLVWSVKEDLSVPVIRAIAQLAGKDLNAVLLRILTTAPDNRIEPLRILIAMINAEDDESALKCFVRASKMSQPVRLVAANRIADFHDQPFKDYVAEWLGFETDPQVREALERAHKQHRAGKSWNASRAAGPPDANPDSDDPNAWASANPDGGLEWLELTYSPPLPASSVRIYEVNAKGAVAEIRARDVGGAWQTLWAGTTSTNPSGPLTIEFPATGYAVGTLRVILDTKRSPSWNEIDAVELIGPQGRAWASDARASSNYGN
jgi:hypothetical protein